MSNDTGPSFEQLLTDALMAAETTAEDGRPSEPARAVNPVFSPQKFFTRWFRDAGNAYFFLFKKNLRVTNIQLAELFSLVCTFNQCPDAGRPIRDLQFHGIAEFGRAIEGLVHSFQRDPADPRRRYAEVARCYSSILRRAVAVDVFHGSCAVFVPPHISIDLKAICACSGYVHSCGRNVFVRRVAEAGKDEFMEALAEHLGRHPFGERKGFFSVYAHEDFTSFDREVAGDLRHGLDDVKIYVEKFFMGPDSLVSVLKEVKDRFRTQLVIPEPGDYTKKHKEFRKTHDIDQSRTVWLIVDSAVEEGGVPGPRKTFYICYDQEFYNNNPFHLFDENKPAWVAHTTIPHTLAGAMINITRPHWPPEGQVVLADPFVGTGTTWLEALKDDRLRVESGDIAPVAPLLAADNAYFFSASPRELKGHLELLGEILHQDFDPGASSVAARGYGYAAELAKRMRTPGADIPTFFSPEVVTEVASKSPVERLLIYVALRTELRHIAAFDREAETWLTAFRHETRALSAQMRRLRELREMEPKPAGQSGPLLTLEGDYSTHCSVNSAKIAPWSTLAQAASVIHVRDARDLRENSCDVIICDPPYGFNVEHNAAALAGLYTDVIRTMIRALRDDGQLVLCVPEHSYTGRPLVYFTDKEVIVQQVLTLAEECGREVITPARSMPPPAALMRAPYYWESDRALRRSILHFRLRQRPTAGRGGTHGAVAP